MPIINPVMAAEARGAFRKGRYPTLSMIIPRSEVASMAKTIVSAKMSQLGSGSQPTAAIETRPEEMKNPM
jgi:hypothetical protein